jgi:AraC-like DNA-binding protein
MTPLSSFRAMLEDPVGHYFLGHHVAIWCLDTKLVGVTLWGRPSSDDVDLLVALMDRPHHPALATRCDQIFDGRRISGTDADAVEALYQGLIVRRNELSTRLRRLAVIRPEGIAGAIMLGAFHIFPLGVPWKSFTELDTGLAWLERGDAVTVSQELEGITHRLVGDSATVARLRAVLLEARLDIGLAEAARRMGFGARTLQRALGDLGTTFRQVREQERMEAAKRLLAETDLKIDAISRRLGYASAAQFTTFFRKRIGTPPASWRGQQGRPVRSEVDDESDDDIVPRTVPS